MSRSWTQNWTNVFEPRNQSKLNEIEGTINNTDSKQCQVVNKVYQLPNGTHL